MEENLASAAAQVSPFEAAARTGEAISSDESEGTSSSYDSDQFITDTEMPDHKDPEHEQEPELEQEPEQQPVDDDAPQETVSQPRVHHIVPRHVPEPEPSAQQEPEDAPEERSDDSDSDRYVRSSDDDSDYHYGRSPYSSGRRGMSSSDYEEFDIRSRPKGRSRGLSARCHYYNDPEEYKVPESAGGAPGSYDVVAKRKPLIIRAKNCVQNLARKQYDAVAKLTRYCKKQFS
ncbi:hypothetical protein BBBOND_0110340 [Babesia bigemina]|uniref:Uncharacterized protein n=1 Tax=Babesia bigemina TaxID=5866 RepID=A0A061D1S4_BABBI|nr:hypothetical protein BBBOND_0110340 [Babesia bigemina]CDR94736.1 hypothetical protein BBBOND_0110340 [Babesia bigemina]|eukprot:XP_012766922.1 hypothetical protein BBBOND_0110340 [Babesia bigemina]